ncbi:MAG: hypothetical protein L7F78_26685 [Syntrophales bacterium LBB04]|nr:hypothetical protein [Syntrophales bacterium LBB04]
MVRRIGEVTTILPVFQSIPLFQFEDEISDKQHKLARLYQSKAVRCTLTAIDRADKPEVLEGAERLAALQKLFANMLAYMENKEGFSVSVGESRKAMRLGSYSYLCPLQQAPTIFIK